MNFVKVSEFSHQAETTPTIEEQITHRFERKQLVGQEKTERYHQGSEAEKIGLKIL